MFHYLIKMKQLNYKETTVVHDVNQENHQTYFEHIVFG